MITNLYICRPLKCYQCNLYDLKTLHSSEGICPHNPHGWLTFRCILVPRTMFDLIFWLKIQRKISFNFIVRKCFINWISTHGLYKVTPKKCSIKFLLYLIKGEKIHSTNFIFLKTQDLTPSPPKTIQNKKFVSYSCY